MQLSLNERSQAEMCDAHFDGAPGVLVSGLIWAIAGSVCDRVGVREGVWALLVGGAAISPISIVLTKLLGRSGKPSAPNSLNQLAGASTIWLIACCFMAYGLYHLNPLFFFPAMMLTIGCRYTTFSTIFGKAIYWILGSSLIGAAWLTIYFQIAPTQAVYVGALIELAFSAALFIKAKPSIDQQPRIEQS